MIMSQKSYDGTATLYLIPTPIGNYEDITMRALNILKEVEVIFSEDTRETAKLLKNFGISKKLIASHNFNESNNKEKLFSYLENGQNVGLVSDQGTPIISDPGYDLVRYALEKGFNVVGLPGATAFVPALITSGLNPHPFLFYGFLNSHQTKRIKELEDIKKYPITVIIYEAPHRLMETLEDVKKVLGNIKISISREISKKYEEIYRGYVADIVNEITIKGEFVIVMEIPKQTEIKISVMEHVNLFLKEGYDIKEAIKLTAKERKLKKQEVYNIYHKIGDK
jgi:16S rRNA (cytidine1402-2'-O)-methyltransferase